MDREKEDAGISEERLRLLIENALDLVTVVKPDGTIDYVGSSVERLLGYKPEELIGGNIFDMINPDQLSLARGGLEYAAGRPGVTQYMEIEVRHKDGSWRLHEASSRNLLDNPVVGGIVINSRDVTERRHMEEGLRFERAQLLSIFDSIDEPVYVADPFTHEILYANRAIRDAFGKELVGGICFREFQGLDRPCDFCTNDIILKERYRPYQWEHYNPVLGRRYMIIDRIIRWPDGRDVRFELAVDITEREKAERLLRVQKDLALRLSETINLRDICGISLETVMDITGMECGAVYLAQEDTQALELVYSQGIPEALAEAVKHCPEGDPRARGVFQGAPVFTASGGPDLLRAGGGDTAKFRSGAVVPLRVEGRVIGCVVAASREEKEVPPYDREVLEALASQIGQALTRSRLVSALRDSEERYRLLHDYAGEAIFTYDKDLRMVSVNRMTCEKTGYSQEELIGKNVFELGIMHPDDLERAKRDTENLLSSGVGGRREVRFLRKDGSIMLAEVTGAPLTDGEGRVTAVTNIASDITDRKRAEEALRESERELRVIFESTGTAMCIIEPDSTISRINREFEKLSGYSREEVEGRMKYEEFLHPGDLEIVKRHAREFLRGGRKGPGNYEVRVVVKGGRVIDSLASMDFLPGTNRAVLSIMDITDRKRAEEALRESWERYHTTFESTGTAMFLVDKDATISDVNREIEKMFGYSREEVAGKMRYMEFIAPDDLPKVKDFSIRLMKGLIKGPVRYEAKAVRKDGSLLDALMNVNVLPGIDKSVVSLIDISDKKAYERELEKQAEQLRNFLDIAAHELRHPATLLKGYAITLDQHGEKMDDETWASSMRAIAAGSDRLVGVVEELLDVSRIERRRFQTVRKEEEIAPLVELAVGEMKVRGCTSSIFVDVDNDVGSAAVDAEKLLRLLIILLDNAAKYSSAGTDIEVVVEKGEGELVFSVLDRGIGIPDEEPGPRPVYREAYRRGTRRPHLVRAPGGGRVHLPLHPPHPITMHTLCVSWGQPPTYTHT